MDGDGNILLADEIHTSDSSRYWFADSYAERVAAGGRPDSFDKDFIRTWVSARCDPYAEDVPEIPADIVLEASRIYIDLAERITGVPFTVPAEVTPVLERIRGNLAGFF